MFLQEKNGEQLWFIFQKTKYIYDAEEKKQFFPLSFPDNHSIKYYMEWKGYQEESEIKNAEKLFGQNKWVVIINILHLMSENVVE